MYVSIIFREFWPKSKRDLKSPDKQVLAVNKSEQNNINDYIKILLKIINKTFWREILTFESLIINQHTYNII